MITRLCRRFERPSHSAERDADARLEKAQQDLESLRERGETAVQFLAVRRGRNHWREGIEDMIRGIS